MNQLSTPQTFAQARTAPGSTAHSAYRPDIDGLRAIAVLAVVLTHARIAGFSGGFIGVDVFFVISGFLIFRNLDHARQAGTFSFWGFYGRRLRRTLPALYLVGAVTLAVGFFVLMPGDLDALAWSLVATLLFVPNILFLTQTGYFDHTAMSKPLLHTWSLGVEEQFYALAPLLPLALSRLGRRARTIVLLSLFAAGLIFCAALQRTAPDAAFYLMPTRLWEFLAGCLVAEQVFPALRNRWLAEAAAGLSLVVLLASIGLFNSATPHPGLLTALPCLATAALIHIGSTKTTLVSRILSHRILVGIGLISYSLYLWHWPLLVFMRYAEVPASPAILLAAGALLLSLSVLSWRLVETPFRAPGSPLRKAAGLLLPATALALTAASVMVSIGQGLPGRFPATIASVARFYDYRDLQPYREGQCFITSKNALRDYDRATCLRIDPKRRNVLLMGDSHAAHLWTGLRDGWPGTNFLQATASGCMPLLGTKGAHRCTAMMADMLHHFVPNHKLDGVILAGFWEPSEIPQLKATIAYLKPLVGKVTVFGPIIRYDEPLATLLAKSLLHGDLRDVKKHEVDDIAGLDATMQKAIAPLTTYVSIYQAMCPGGTCQLFAAPGVPMQFDYHHLTRQGAARLMQDIRARQNLRF
ncbi:MAG: acyltransferase family protein [Methylovirgula sp.]